MNVNQVFFVFLGASLIFYLIRMRNLYNYLHVYHRDTWTILDGSKINESNNVNMVVKLFIFIFGNEFKTLNDSKLTTKCLTLKWVIVAYFIIFIIAISILPYSSK